MLNLKRWITEIVVLTLVFGGVAWAAHEQYFPNGIISNGVITGNGVLTVSPDGTNEVFQVNDGTVDFTDGNAGTTGTLTVASDGGLSYNKSFSTTGTLLGAVDVIADDNSLSAAQCYGSANKLNGAETTTLPAAVAGMSVLLYSDDATKKTVDPNGTDHIWLNGADLGAGNSIDSPAAVGDFIVLVAFSNNNWYSMGQSGTWVITP